MPKPWQNKEGYNDFTAYNAVNNAEAEKRRQTDVIQTMLSVARLAGYEVTSWITLNKTDRFDRKES